MAQPEIVEYHVGVLVIGGGFAGTWSALRAAECGADVLLVDKAYVSRSGASTMSGGVTTAPMPGDDLESWAKEVTELGGHEGDQSWTRLVLEGQMQRVKDLDDWGVPIVREENGDIRRVVSRGGIDLRVMQYSPQAAMEVLRQRALAAGATIHDKLAIVELLTSDGEYPTKGRVCGAIGIERATGHCHVIHAKAVVLATGLMTMKGYRPIDNDSGDGWGMALRVGARITDMEFSAGGTFEVICKNYRFLNFNVALSNGVRLLNANGERFIERYDPVRLERTEQPRLISAFMVELLEGRGPVYADFTVCSDGFWEALDKARAGRPSAILTDLIPDPRAAPIPAEATWSMWNGGKGGLITDTECRTNVPGLLAAGGVSRNAPVGRHGSAGTPTAWAMTTGHRSGEIAAADAARNEHAEVNREQLATLCERLYAPLHAEASNTVDEYYREVFEIIGSPLDLMVLNAEKIERAIERFEDLRERAQGVTVTDVHSLLKVHELRTAIDIYQLVYRSMLDRTESRESFYREDYPYTDDYEWMCWHVAVKTDEGIVFTKEPIPFERFKYQPPPPERKLSSVAAVFKGVYEHATYDDRARAAR